MPNTVLRSTLVPPFPVGTPPIAKSQATDIGPRQPGNDAAKAEPRLSYPHVKFFQSVEQAINSSAQVAGTIPVNSTAPGEAGTFAADANFLYYCYAKNSWRRIAGAAF